MNGTGNNTDGEDEAVGTESRQIAAYALLERKEAYLRTINQFALSLIEITTIDEIVWYAAREVVQKMGFVDCVIYVLDAGRGVLVQAAAIGEKNPHGEEIVNRLEIPVSSGITGHVASTRKSVISADISKDDRYLADVNVATSEICVPLIYDDTLFGVIDCEDPRTDHFTSEHLEVLTIVAAMLSAKLAQVETTERLRQAQKMEAVGQLTGGIAHDFNNLLAVIMGNLEMAQEGIAEGRSVEQSLELTMQGAIKATDLIKRLQSFSPKQSFELRACDVGELLTALLPSLQRTLGQSHSLVIEAPETPCLARFDPSLFENAVLNLILNARDAMPDGGEIVMAVAPTVFDGRRDEDQQSPAVCISVSDVGTGMTAKTLERATEPFFTTKDGGAGSGLGLSMVFGFANQFGGELKLDSAPEKGTRVDLILPVVAPETSSGGERTATEEYGGALGPRPASTGVDVKRVLVVEDNRQVMEITLAYLERLGFETLSAIDGVKATDILRSDEVIDMILSDIILPGGIDGIEVIRLARKIRPTTKLLLMSGYPGKSNDNSRIGSVDVPILRKPFRIAELADALQARLDDD